MITESQVVRFETWLGDAINKYQSQDMLRQMLLNAYSQGRQDMLNDIRDMGDAAREIEQRKIK